MHKLERIINKIKLRYYNPNSWNHALTVLKLDYPEEFSENLEFVALKQLDLTLEHNLFRFLLQGYENALVLKQLRGAEFNIENHKLFITLDTLTFEVQTAEELFILKEIFVEGVYNFNLQHDMEDYLLIDIGMNVSYASCYFAKVKQIPQIIYFEPFTPTYNQGKVNIALNDLDGKIDARNYGLGGCNEVLSVPYAPEFRGQVGIQGTDYIRSNITESAIEKIYIKNAFEPLLAIVNDFSSKRFIMKIDCEGAEYNLIERIPLKMLERCDLIMMEWHEKGPKPIEQWLQENGFTNMSFYPYSKRAGMIYAIKS